MTAADAIERLLGGADVARDLYRALTPATNRAIARIAALPGDPPPGTCIALALDEGASIEAILAVTHGIDLAGATDPELIAVQALCVAYDALDDALDDMLAGDLPA